MSELNGKIVNPRSLDTALVYNKAPRPVLGGAALKSSKSKVRKWHAPAIYLPEGAGILQTCSSIQLLC
jgi:hypothetical protein